MKYTDEEIRELAIGSVLNAENEGYNYAIKKYLKHLEDVDFIFVDENNGFDFVSPATHMFKLEKGQISSVFYSDKLTVQNQDFLNGKKDRIYVNYDIGLDTQVVSYIERYLSGKLDEVNIPVIMPLRVKRNMASEINIDAYVNENCIINKEFSSKQLLNIWSFFYFLNTPTMSDTEAKIKADESTDEIVKFVKRTREANVYKERYDYTYCTLLKIVLLNFEKKGTKEKLIELLKFEKEVTCTMDMVAINIAIAYWEQGTKLRFFGKVQKGRKDILNVLRNMAWDVFHWTQTLLDFKTTTRKGADINIPLFYSVDMRFLELSKIIKLKAVAIDKRKNITIPHLESNRLREFLSDDELKEYFGPEALRQRNEKRGYVDTEKIYKELEIELLDKGIF